MAVPYPDPAQQWAEFCDRLKLTGTEILGKRADLPDRDRADGLRYLTRVLADGVHARMGPPALEQPFMHRFIDAPNAWGLPNVDNTYLFSRISGQRAYRLSGNARGRDFIVTLGTGEHPCWDWKEVAEFSSAQIPVAANGDFEVLLSVSEPSALPLEPEATLLMVRDYLLDWDDEPGRFHLECLDEVPAEPELNAPAHRLDTLARYFDESARLWSGYPDMWRDRPPNTFSEPMRVPGGSTGLLGYSVGSAHLRDGQAMLMEFRPPAGRYWVVHLYSRWGVPLDPAVTLSTLNSRQAAPDPDPDGAVRIVVGAADPGVANWLDTSGHPEVSIWYRLSPWEGMTTPTASVHAEAEVVAVLPYPRAITPEQRREQIAGRRRGMARRFQR